MQSAGQLINEALQSQPASHTYALAASAARRLIHATARLYDNPNTILEGFAVDAAGEGRAAYWKTTGYSHQTATAFAYAANQSGIQAALIACVDKKNAGKSASELLDTLIPLNVKATVELKSAKDEAYWEDA